MSARRFCSARPMGWEFVRLDRSSIGLSDSEFALPASAMPSGRDPVGSGCAASTQLDCESTLYARARHHRAIPSPDVRKLGEIDLVPWMPPRPSEDCKIS